MKRFLPALLVLLPLIAAASPENPAPAVEFLAALHEKDQLKRAEMLLAAAESGVYPADLALIHLTRTAVGTQHGARLRKLAGRRRGPPPTAPTPRPPLPPRRPPRPRASPTPTA